jgi:hypothetical protein
MDRGPDASLVLRMRFWVEGRSMLTTYKPLVFLGSPAAAAQVALGHRAC